jgi:hypothetical protein
MRMTDWSRKLLAIGASCFLLACDASANRDRLGGVGGGAGGDGAVTTSVAGDAGTGGAGTGGAGTGGAGNPTGGATTPTGGGDDGGVGGSNAPPAPGIICDGSEEIRLVLGQSGGYPLWDSGFTEPEGMQTVAYLDGKCRYLVRPRRGGNLVLGQLSATDVAELADDIGWGRLGTLSSWKGFPCNDAPHDFVNDGDYSVGLAGCEINVPPELMLVIANERLWFARLAAAGTPFVGAVGAVAVLPIVPTPSPFAPPPTTSNPWPLATNLATLVVPPDALRTGLGLKLTLFESAADIAALRDLSAAAASNSMTLTSGGKKYWLLLRDEVPAATQTSISAFWDRARTRCLRGLCP